MYVLHRVGELRAANPARPPGSGKRPSQVENIKKLVEGNITDVKKVTRQGQEIIETYFPTSTSI